MYVPGAESSSSSPASHWRCFQVHIFENGSAALIARTIIMGACSVIQVVEALSKFLAIGIRLIIHMAQRTFFFSIRVMDLDRLFSVNKQISICPSLINDLNMVQKLTDRIGASSSLGYFVMAARTACDREAFDQVMDINDPIVISLLGSCTGLRHPSQRCYATPRRALYRSVPLPPHAELSPPNLSYEPVSATPRSYLSSFAYLPELVKRRRPLAASDLAGSELEVSGAVVGMTITVLFRQAGPSRVHGLTDGFRTLIRRLGS